jgi:peptidoglycan/LPS O-acetylase OafA/YrhL
MNLTQWAYLALAAGAGGGLLFAVLLMAGKRYPRWFGAAHGALGLVGLALMGLALYGQGSVQPDRANWGFAAVAAALLGGATLFRLIHRDRRPLPLALVHGTLALAGLVLLYPTAFVV